MNAALQQGHPIVAPGVEYYLITAGGILVALGVIAATFPLLARITDRRRRATVSPSARPLSPSNR